MVYNDKPAEKQFDNRIKVVVLKNITEKCPYCDTDLERYVFSVNNGRTKKPIGRECKKCNKRFIAENLYYNNGHFFEFLNSEDDNPSSAEVGVKRLEKHEQRMKEHFDEKKEREDELRVIDQIINEAGVAEAPDWSAIKKLKANVLQSIVIAYLMNDDSSKSVVSSRWYFVTANDKEFKKLSNNVYKFGSKSIMGRALLEDSKSRNKYFTYLNDRFYVNAKIVFNYELYNELTGKKNGESRTEKNRNSSTNNRVYVYFRLNNKCVINNHKISTVTAKTLNLKTGLSVDVNVFYCNNCKKFFVNYEALKDYISKGIYPALQFVLVENNLSGLRNVSELMIYGYTVREGELTKEQRQRILSWIIDVGLLSKAEIIKDLQFKVSYNGKKPGNEKAKKKWEEDIQFVSHYVKGNTSRIEATFIR